jgi:hypothetical protein
VTRVETVVSELLTALPVIPAPVAEPLLRAVGLTAPDPDFVRTMRDGHLETDAQWAARVLGEAS